MYNYSATILLLINKQYNYKLMTIIIHKNGNDIKNASFKNAKKKVEKILSSIFNMLCFLQ